MSEQPQHETTQSPTSEQPPHAAAPPPPSEQPPHDDGPSPPPTRHHSKDAIEKISFIVGEKGLWGLDRDDMQTITYETGYVFGRILKRLGIRTGPAVLKYTTTKKPANKPTEKPTEKETPIPIHQPDQNTPQPPQPENQSPRKE